MQDIIDYFDRAYIINLEDRTDRRREVVEEFRSIGIDIPNDKIRFYNAQRPTEKGTFPDIGTRGNFNSHRHVLQLAKQDGLRNVLVFEDDVSFRKIDPARIRQIVDRLDREDWDIVHFGYVTPSDEGLEGPLAPWTETVLGIQFFGVNGRFIGPMIDYMDRCEFLPPGHPEGAPILADAAYSHIRVVNPKIRALLAVPNLAHQRSSPTDAHPRSFFDQIDVLQPLTSAIRAFKNKKRVMLDSFRTRRY